MRVLYLDPIGELGGGERSLLDVLAVLQKQPDLKLHLIDFMPGPFLDAVRSVGVSASVLEMPAALTATGDTAFREVGRVKAAARLLGRALRLSPNLVDYSLKLRREVEAFDPDIIHSNGIKAHLLSALIRPRRARLIWHVRDFLGERPLVGEALGAVAWRAHLAIAISRAVAADTARVLPGMRVEPIYDGIDTDTFSPGPGDGTRLDSLAGLAPAKPGTLRIGIVAAYARWKGLDLFLRAAALALAAEGTEQPPLRFYVVGGPLYATAGSQYRREELEQLARDLDIHERVGFIPFQAEVGDIYRSLDVAVHASTRPEPFGRTVVEPMATGRPVIASRAGGAAELFTDGVDALGFTMGSAGDLARAMLSMRDAGLRSRLADAAHKSALARFSRPRLVPEVRRAYALALGATA